MPSSENRSNSIPELISQILQNGEVAALTTLIEAPSGIGAKLLVDSSGKRFGTLGDETVDRRVAAQATAFLQSKEETRVFQVGDFAAGLGDWSNAQILFERIQSEPRLVICGAGHVGAALANLASLLGYRATLIDDRAEFVTRERFPNPGIELIATEDWSDAVRAAVGDGHSVSVAVVTRGHSEDEACMHAILMGGGADYVGLIGSKRRTNIVLERLREHGADNQQLQNVRGPIGLDIGAVTPEEVALAIMAEVVSVRRGGSGGSLSAWRRPQAG